MRHILALGIIAALLITMPGVVVVMPAATTSGNVITQPVAVTPYAATSNNTSTPWWDVAWNDVTGVLSTAGSDASYWIDKGLTGTYDAITSNINNFFGGFVLNGVETTIEDVLGVFLSLIELAAAEISILFGGFILFLEGVAITPALGPFAPVIAMVIVLGILVMAVVIVRLVLDVA